MIRDASPMELSSEVWLTMVLTVEVVEARSMSSKKTKSHVLELSME